MPSYRQMVLLDVPLADREVTELLSGNDNQFVTLCVTTTICTASS